MQSLEMTESNSRNCRLCANRTFSSPLRFLFPINKVLCECERRPGEEGCEGEMRKRQHGFSGGKEGCGGPGGKRGNMGLLGEGGVLRTKGHNQEADQRPR